MMLQRRLLSNILNKSKNISKNLNLKNFSSISRMEEVLYEGNNCLGILAEEYDKWERRVPLTPTHVKTLIDEHDVTVLIQPSTHRIYRDEEYLAAGAEVTEDLSDASVIIGIKQPNIEKLISGKTYFCFSHTIKAQPENMLLLDTMLQKDIRLIDYECIRNENGRIIAFGKWAGIVGMIDILQGFGQRLLCDGISSPFLLIPRAFTYFDYNEAIERLKLVSEHISDRGILPSHFDPMLIGIIGNGNVSQGAQEVIEYLPHEYIDPNDIETLFSPSNIGNLDKNKIYVSVFESSHIVKKNDGGNFDYDEYLSKPNLYHSVFEKKYLKYISVLINGIYWDNRYPKTLTKEGLKEFTLNEFKKVKDDSKHFITFHRDNEGHQNLPLKLKALADISCDINGSIEFLEKTTSIDHPYFTYDPVKELVHDDVNKSGILMMGLDILPTELARDSSSYFGDRLLPLVQMALASTGSSNQGHDMLNDEALNNAIIASHGELKPRYQYIKTEREKQNHILDKTHILLFGSGLVAGPVVKYLSNNPDYHITIVSNDIESEKRLTALGQHENTGIIYSELSSTELDDHLKTLISSSDIVISLLPATLHTIIAEECINSSTNMVTASYVSEEMENLDQAAKNAGIIILNEVGLDPGLDHMSIMKMIHDITSRNGKIKSFSSVCGGLPSPESANNPFNYKFSWSPLGVLKAATNDALYKKNNEIISIDGNNLSGEPYQAWETLNLEVLPNRNSLRYGELYNIPDASTIFRGTLRYLGWSGLIQGLKALDLFDDKPIDFNNNEKLKWKDLLINHIPDYDGSEISLYNILLNDDKVNNPEKVIKALKWLGIFDEYIPKKSKSIIDAFAKILSKKLSYNQNERDISIMHHHVIAEFENQDEIHSSRLMVVGDEEFSSMAKTVGLTTAVCTELILNGTITSKGVQIPIDPEIYLPALKLLKKENIIFDEDMIIKEK